MVDVSLRDSADKADKEKIIKTENIFEQDKSKLICDYGCEREAKHKISNGKLCCSQYPIQCPAIRYKHGKPMKDDYKVKVYCDCFYRFIVYKSEVPKSCPKCGRNGTYVKIERYIEWM